MSIGEEKPTPTCKFAQLLLDVFSTHLFLIVLILYSSGYRQNPRDEIPRIGNPREKIPKVKIPATKSPELKMPRDKIPCDKNPPRYSHLYLLLLIVLLIIHSNV